MGWKNGEQRMKLLLMPMLVFLTGCALGGNPEDAKSFLQTLEFEGDEYGKITARGNIKIGAIPFFATEVYLDYEKIKDAPVYEDAVPE